MSGGGEYVPPFGTDPVTPDPAPEPVPDQVPEPEPDTTGRKG